MAPTQSNKKYNIYQPLLLSLMVAFGILIGYKMNDQPEIGLIQRVDEGHGGYDIGRVEEVLRYIDSRYVEEVDDARLVDKAIYAIMDELDPHSMYLSPESLISVNDKMKGSFRGIGVESIIIDDTLTIVRTLANGPAGKKGIQALDQLIMVNDSLVAGVKMPFDSIRNLLKKEVNGKLNMTFKRGNKEVEFSFPLEDIVVNSAENYTMINDTVGYIKIDQFSSNTYKEFMDGLESLIDESEKINEGRKLGHPNDLIIDLRDNPGGYLPQATKILNQLFEEKDQLLVYTEGRNSNKKNYNTNGKNFFKFDKISVLINENSASGSEIIAGAIQDQDRGIIIGRKSFGKGLVQDQYELSNGGALRLTIAKYYTPSGRLIQKAFTDLAEYNNEVNKRLQNGELFRPSDLKVDSTSNFRSLRFGRDLPQGVGIIPDVFVPADSMKYTGMYYDLMDFIPHYIIKITMRNERKQGEVVDVQFNDYFDYLVGRKYIEPYTDVSAEIKRMIERQLQAYQIFLNEGENAELAFDLEEDSFIEQSMEYFNGNIRLDELATLQFAGKLK